MSSGDTEVCEVYHGAATLIHRFVHGNPKSLACSDGLLISQQTFVDLFESGGALSDIKAKHVYPVRVLLLC